MTDGLKNCPFCDGDRVDYDSMLFTKKGKVIYAKCPDCGASFRCLEHIYNWRVFESVLLARVDRKDKEIEQLRAEVERMQLVLIGLRKDKHAICEDCWYSCPKSGDCCDDSQPKDVCTCGVDAWNEIIDRVLLGMEKNGEEV